MATAGRAKSKTLKSKKPKQPKAQARPKPSAPNIRRAAKPESPAVLDGVDHSGTHSAAREVSWSEFDRVVQALAREALEKFQPDAIVGIAHGGVFVGGAIASAMKREFFPVRISRRSRDQGPTAAPKLSSVMPKELKGRRVLVVDDIAASGDTLELAIKLARGVKAKALATCTLVCRPDGYEPDCFWQRSDTFFVFPWDYALPHGEM